MSELALADIWRIIGGISDPEIPVISVVELGIIREVHLDRDGVDIAITPTFSGCPAFQAIQDAIKETLEGAGVQACEDPGPTCAAVEHRLDFAGRSSKAQGIRPGSASPAR